MRWREGAQEKGRSSRLFGSGEHVCYQNPNGGGDNASFLPLHFRVQHKHDAGQRSSRMVKERGA